MRVRSSQRNGIEPYRVAVLALLILGSLGFPIGAFAEDPPGTQPTAADQPEDVPAKTETDQPMLSPPDPMQPPVSTSDDGDAPPDSHQDFAKGTAREKWKIFADAWRGLSTWNLFDDRVTLRVYARLQIDGSGAKGNKSLETEFGELRNSVKFRRLTVLANGTIDNHFRYVLGYEFGADRGIWDAYVEGIDSGLTVFGYNIGDFRVGFFQEPFSLERVSGSYYGGFLERSLPVQAFAPGNNLGYMVHRGVAKGRISWALGFFSFGTNSEENASSSSLSVTGRITGLPLWSDEGRSLIHVGLAFSTRSPQSSETRYFSRPEARFVQIVADTGNIDAGTINLVGIEAAMVQGPLWLQSELIHSSLSSTQFGDLGFWGSYFQVGYFLTGEVRPYDRATGRFRRVYPRGTYEGGVPFKRSNGGAFEVTGRISNVDLNDKELDGGRVLDLSLGLNWYANSTSKVMLNYIRSKVDGVGNANILLMRYQYRPLPR